LTPELDKLVAEAPAGVLGTIAADGSPHLVPVTFAIDGDRVYTAVDHKPKSTRRLQRLANIERDPRVTLLADHYDDDWSRLWWCRLDGTASIVERDETASRLLAAKYRQYREHPVVGPVIVIAVRSRTGWQA
jgi:PPOX class probable F420-dependent enzyme